MVFRICPAYCHVVIVSFPKPQSRVEKSHSLSPSPIPPHITHLTLTYSAKTCLIGACNSILVEILPEAAR
jgi:hypothetical protein